MNINSINGFNVNNTPHLNPKKPNAVLNKSAYMSNLSDMTADMVTFKGNKANAAQYKYADSWYLKDETILAQDGFSTTIEDKGVKPGMFDKFLKKSHPKKLYDLPLRLREDLKAKDTDTVILNMPEDILSATGLSDDEFIKSINKINALISLVYPRYDAFEEKTQQSFKMQMGNSTANVTRFRQGFSGIVYKIEVEGCRPLALKHYLNRRKINLDEGAFPEIAVAKKMNEDNVRDIPLLYCANPYDGWMLSEFIDEDYETRKSGMSILDYASINKLVFGDRNSGNTVQGKDGRIFVDFGYIEPTFPGTFIRGFDRTVFLDVISKANSINFENLEYTSILGLCANISLCAQYGCDEAKESLIKKYSKHPEFKLFCDTLHATEYVLQGKDVPKELGKDLQEAYEQSGFIGDAVELVKTCNQ